MVQELGIGVRAWGLGFSVESLWCRVWSLVQGLGCRIQGLGLSVKGLGRRVWSLGFRIQD